MSAPDEGTPAALSAGQREVLRGRLLAAIERACSDLGALRHDFDTIVSASAQSNADDEHDPEGATIAFERAQVSAAIDRALATESLAQQALERLGAGTYGRCDRCGVPIGFERLQALPATSRCMQHAGR